MKKQLIFVLTAASATGKSSCARQVCKRDDSLVLSISHSTRPRRPNEVNGVDKYFVSDKDFDDLQNKNQFVEQTTIFGHRCGHTRAALEQLSDKNKDIIMILDYQGLCQIKEKYPSTVSIFLLPPNIQAISERIQNRPEAEGVDISARLQSAKREMQDYVHYDYVVFNDRLDHAVDDVLAIVAAERLRTQQQLARHNAVIQELTS